MINFEKERIRMVEDQIIGRGIKDERVLVAMRKVPRHEFLPVAIQGMAYQDSALPLGEGQTMSQPYMVAVMSELLELSGMEHKHRTMGERRLCLSGRDLSASLSWLRISASRRRSGTGHHG